jgi:hypothetical protein
VGILMMILAVFLASTRSSARSCSCCSRSPDYGISGSACGRGLLTTRGNHGPLVYHPRLFRL